MAADLPNRDKLDIQLSKSELLQSSARADLLSEFLNSAAYSGLQAPVQAAAQVVDKVAGTKTESAVNIAAAPQKAETLSGHWLAQEAGAAIGMVPWFLALHKGLSTLMEKSALAPNALKLAAEGKSLSATQLMQANLFRAGEAGVSGLFIGGALTPVAPGDQRGFWEAKGAHALSSAAAFSTLSLGSSMLGMASERVGPLSSTLSKIVGSNSFTAAVAGIPAGLVSANMESGLAGNGWASSQDNLNAVLGFSIIGAGFGAGADRLGLGTMRPAPETRLALDVENSTAAVRTLETQKSSAPARIDSARTASDAKAKETMTESSQPSTKYVSDSTDANGVRHIVKADGTQVMIEPSGKVTVSGQPERVQSTPPSTEAKEFQARERSKPPDFSYLPLEQRPLNVGGSSSELSAAEMSNFAHTPFTLDGRRFGSVEALYVWLKWSGNPEKQAEAMSMHGYEAKKFGKPSTNTQAEYDGQQLSLGSPEHHALLKRGIQQKLIEHPDVALRFAETYPREIIHDLGYPENPNTRLNARDFSKILTELRQDLVDGKLVTKDGSIAELKERARMEAESKPSMTPMTVSDLLKTTIGTRDAEGHAIQKYVDTLKDLDKPVTRVIGSGGDSIAMETSDGNILKVTGRTLSDRMGTRPFDLPILERGIVDSGSGLVYWFTQPQVKTPVTYAQFNAFKAEIAKQGYIMNDAGANQLGEYHGVVKLIDPFAVQKLD